MGKNLDIELVGRQITHITGKSPIADLSVHKVGS